MGKQHRGNGKQFRKTDGSQRSLCERSSFLTRIQRENHNGHLPVLLFKELYAKIEVSSKASSYQQSHNFHISDASFLQTIN